MDVVERIPAGPRPFERRTCDPVILCVDDEPHILTALRRSLSSDPYEVITARGAEEALCWFGELPIALVITDECMPGTAGTELLREVRQRSPRTGRAILTAFPSLSLAARGRDAGAEAILSKPWSDDSLRGMIRRVLEDRQRH